MQVYMLQQDELHEDHEILATTDDESTVLSHYSRSC